MANDILKNNIQNDIRSIDAYDSLEQTHINDAVDWIDSGINIFRIEKPDKPPKHLVAYFALIDPEQKSILLTDHIKAQLWLPSGGHVNPGELPLETVRREAMEELRIKATFLHNTTQPFFITVTETVGLTPGHTDVSLWYLLRGNRHDYLYFDRQEFNDIEWFTFDEILESSQVIFDPHMQRFTRKLLNYLGD